MAAVLTIEPGRQDAVVEVSAYAQQAINEAVDYVHKSDDVVIEGVSDFMDVVNEGINPMRMVVGLKFDGVRIGLSCWSATDMMLKGIDIECDEEWATLNELRSCTHTDAFKVGFAEDEDDGTYTATVASVCWSDPQTIVDGRKLTLTPALVVGHCLVRLRHRAGDRVPQVKHGLIYRSY